MPRPVSHDQRSTLACGPVPPGNECRSLASSFWSLARRAGAAPRPPTLGMILGRIVPIACRSWSTWPVGHACCQYGVPCSSLPLWPMRDSRCFLTSWRSSCCFRAYSRARPPCEVEGQARKIVLVRSRCVGPTSPHSTRPKPAKHRPVRVRQSRSQNPRCK